MNAELPARLAIHLADSVDAARRQYRKRLKRCQRKFSESAVHELRVETRRLLALLDLLEEIGFETSIRKLRKIFKKQLDASDELRDAQVQWRLLKPLWPGFPEADRFRKILKRLEKKLISKLARSIRSAKVGPLNRRLKTVETCLRSSVRAASRDTSHAQALRAAQKAFAQLTRLRRGVRANRPATIHRLRVVFKRFRYLSELLQPFLPRVTTAHLDRMRNYQAAAGDLQDIVVLLGRLVELVHDGKLKTREAANLQHELLLRRRRAIDCFMARVDELFEFRPHRGTAGVARKY